MNSKIFRGEYSQARLRRDRVSRCAIWGASLTGKAVIHELEGVGVDVAMVIDSSRQGEFAGHRIFSPPEGLRPDLPVIVSMMRSPKAISEVIEELERRSVPYYLMPRPSQKPWIQPLFGSQYNARPPSEKYPLWKRVVGAAEIVKARRDWLKVDVPKLEALKNKHVDVERAFVICNGPSLNQCDLSKLAHEVTFGTNAIFVNFERMGFRPTYYIVEDNLVAEDRATIIASLRGMTKLLPYRAAYCIPRDSETIYYFSTPDHQGAIPYEFSDDCSRFVCSGNTVTFTCLQFAWYMGIKKVYLVGADHDWAMPASLANPAHPDRSLTVSERFGKFVFDALGMVPRHGFYQDGATVINDSEPTVNHFDASYVGGQYRWHRPQQHLYEEMYLKARQFFEAHGGKIYNATVGGKLEVFERADFDLLF